MFVRNKEGKREYQRKYYRKHKQMESMRYVVNE